MAQKFVITRRGILRLGHVSMHKDLLQAGDACMGGGFWRFDPVTMRLELSGRSYDFGEPMWEWLLGSGLTLKVPHQWQGMRIVYAPDDPAQRPLAVSEEFAIEYI
ncbi:MAG: hypothetical protein I3J02_01355 [Prevotella sp.]|nr:hypothetical protein [Prevotella sp.]